LDMVIEPDHWPVRELAACGRLFTATQARGPRFQHQLSP
jgi:hypothetical protein